WLIRRKGLFRQALNQRRSARNEALRHDLSKGFRHCSTSFRKSRATILASLAAMKELIADLQHEFARHRRLAERAMAHLDDDSFFRRAHGQVNPIALIVKHLAGNLQSRWTVFLTSDGEKNRQRDDE